MLATFRARDVDRRWRLRVPEFDGTEDCVAFVRTGYVTGAIRERRASVCPGFQNRRGVPGRARTQDMGAQEHHFLDDDTASLEVEIDVNNSDSRAKLRWQRPKLSQNCQQFSLSGSGRSTSSSLSSPAKRTQQQPRLALVNVAPTASIALMDAAHRSICGELALGCSSLRRAELLRSPAHARHTETTARE